MNSCYECHSQLSPGVTTEFYTVADHLYLVIENVPALICRQCGTAYTDREITDTLMRLVQRVRESLPTGGRATLTYDFRSVEQLAKTA